MEEERRTVPQSHQGGEPVVEKPDQVVEVTNRGLFDGFLGKKKPAEDQEDKKQQEEGLASGMEKVSVEEPAVKKDESSTLPQSYQGGEAAVEQPDQVDVTDRGLFGFGNKKAEEEDKKAEEEGLVSGMEKVSVAQPEVKKEEEHHQVKKEEGHEDGHKHETLFTKLHRSSSSSSSSSSSDEEEEVIDANGEMIKRKKKKGLKEKITGKLPGHKDGEGEHVTTGLPAPAPPASMQTHGDGGHHDTAVPVEKIDADVKTEAAPPAAVPEEKKGFMEKIKEKLPGGHKKPEDAAAVPPVTHAAPEPVHTPAPTPTAEEASSTPDGTEKKQGFLGKIMDKLSHKPAGEEDKTAAAAGEHKTTA